MHPHHSGNRFELLGLNSEKSLGFHPFIVVDLPHVPRAMIVKQADDHIGRLEAIFQLT